MSDSILDYAHFLITQDHLGNIKDVEFAADTAALLLRHRLTGRNYSDVNGFYLTGAWRLQASGVIEVEVVYTVKKYITNRKRVKNNWVFRLLGAKYKYIYTKGEEEVTFRKWKSEGAFDFRKLDPPPLPPVGFQCKPSLLK